MRGFCYIVQKDILELLSKLGLEKGCSILKKACKGVPFYNELPTKEAPLLSKWY